MQHTITALVENRPGVLARVTGLFARRGFNIESLAVSITEDPTVSRMTIVVGGDDKALEQISKQLNKLIDVIKVYDYTDTPNVARELALIKIHAEASRRSRRSCSLRDLPRQDHRHQRADLHHRVHRRPGEDRRPQGPPGAVRHQGAGPHRQDRPLPWRPLHHRAGVAA